MNPPPPMPAIKKAWHSVLLMKFHRLLVGLALGISGPSIAQPHNTVPVETTAQVASITADFAPLNYRIAAKLKVLRSSSADSTSAEAAAALAPEIADFDALLAKHRGEKTDATARVAYARAMLYYGVLGNEAKARELLAALKDDYPDTSYGKQVDALLVNMDHQKEAYAKQAALVGKQAPELHFIWSNRGGLKTLSDLRGKVVVLDFWATWCGPCIAYFPHIRELAAYYQNADVVVIGVTSIQGTVANLQAKPIDTKGDPTREIAFMPDFIKAKEMTWTVALSEEPVINPAYAVRGIPHVVVIAPDGTTRYSGLPITSPLNYKTKRIDAILKEFNLPVPKA